MGKEGKNNSCQILFFSLRKIFCSFITNVVPTKSLSSYHRASVYGKLHPATRGYLLFPPPSVRNPHGPVQHRRRIRLANLPQLLAPAAHPLYILM